jgi:hypothetical protein
MEQKLAHSEANGTFRLFDWATSGAQQEYQFVSQGGRNRCISLVHALRSTYL